MALLYGEGARPKVALITGITGQDGSYLVTIYSEQVVLLNCKHAWLDDPEVCGSNPGEGG